MPHIISHIMPHIMPHIRSQIMSYINYVPHYVQLSDYVRVAIEIHFFLLLFSFLSYFDVVVMSNDFTDEVKCRFRRNMNSEHSQIELNSAIKEK